MNGHNCGQIVRKFKVVLDSLEYMISLTQFFVAIFILSFRAHKNVATELWCPLLLHYYHRIEELKNFQHGQLNLITSSIQ